jgi:ADP-ribose pyrophosphatase YjhB (NUDIX family)
MRDLAVCYITRGRREILAFEVAGGRGEPGVRLPAGRVESGELPAAVAARDAHRVTGLTDLGAPEPLGVRDYHGALDGRRHVHRRYFFWIEASAHTPHAWTHRVAADAVRSETTLRLAFTAIDTVRIRCGMDALVPRLRERLSCEDVAVCYVTRGQEVLVFEGHPGGGVQVVAAWVEAGETFADAAVREALEEAELRISDGRFLGTQEWHHPGAADVHELRSYYWFRAPAATPDAWSHRVSAGDADGGRVFRHRFMPVASAPIDWDLDVHLPPLLDLLP